MPTFDELHDFLQERKRPLIIAADAEPVSTKKVKGNLVEQLPAGGVAVALDPSAKAANGVYIARARTEEDHLTANSDNEVIVHPNTPYSYTLKRLFLTSEETDAYYFGFSNQTLWPLSHVAFERPEFQSVWFEGYKKVNEYFAKAIQEKMKDSSIIWVNDYHLSLVPSLLRKKRDTTIGLFWHIPWPTWEIFRILPQRHEILEGLLASDFLGFHRGYHARNFIETVDRELEARIDRETNKIYYKDHVTTVRNLPMGIDTDVIRSIVEPEEPDTFVTAIIRNMLGIEKKTVEQQTSDIDTFFEKNSVILGVDRLDYTKGLRHRLMALDLFFQNHPDQIGKVSYLGVLAPSREKIPSYKQLKNDVYQLTRRINEKYQTEGWQPIRLASGVYTRDEILNMYRKANVCLVTPLDDGMNLVSKEFIIAASKSENPGVLVLSRFAGSAIDLTDALIVNPYNIESVADAIYEALTMPRDERKSKTAHMAEVLEERNVYGWAMRFIRATIDAGDANK